MTKLFRWRPARLPRRATLKGRRPRLEPLDPRAHTPALFAATHGPGHDPQLWDYMFVGPFARASEFRDWLRACARPEDAMVFAIVDGNNAAGGHASEARISPGH